jgi:hypothetical protein
MSKAGAKLTRFETSTQTALNERVNRICDRVSHLKLGACVPEKHTVPGETACSSGQAVRIQA